MKKGFVGKIVILALALTIVAAIVFAWPSEIGPKIEKPADRTFFTQFVIAGGPIVWFLLLPMSVITIALTVEHAFSIRRRELAPAGAEEEITALIHQFGRRELSARLAKRSDLLSTAVADSIRQAGLVSKPGQFRNLIAESLQNQALRLIRKIEWINIIGSVAPMIGLFGTVFGMIKAFNAIVTAGGQPQPAQLAAGISVALVTTFWGLLTAIPALAVYGIFRNRIETLTSQAAAQAESVLSKLIASEKEPDDLKKQNRPSPKVPIRTFS